MNNLRLVQKSVNGDPDADLPSWTESMISQLLVILLHKADPLDLQRVMSLIRWTTTRRARQIEMRVNTRQGLSDTNQNAIFVVAKKAEVHNGLFQLMSFEKRHSG